MAVGERKTRTQQYINLSEKKLHAFYTKNLGRHEEVLVEEALPGGTLTGFSGNYIRTELPFRPDQTGQIVAVTLSAILPDGSMQGAWME